jgi:putative tryptophan/tyrosine transport system substrate-binding protein
MFDMRRREFITLVGGAAAAPSLLWPLAARAQSNPAAIGVLGSGFPASSAILIEAFKQGMRENGLTEGRDYVLDVRWAKGDYTRFVALADELVQRKVGVIVATTIAAAHAAQRAAPGTPIVMTGLIDPVGAGLIASLARPGGNTTGISNMAQDMTSKGLELLRTMVPTARTFATLFNPANLGNHLIMEDVRTQANTLGVTIQPIEFKGPAELDAIFETAASNGPDALLVLGDATLIDLRERIAALALRHRLPTVSSLPELTDAGGLIGYGPSRRDIYRRAANYVRKVINGAKPADLPVEQPTLIELSINMKTAKTLGIAVPDSLLARSNRVIE